MGMKWIYAVDIDRDLKLPDFPNFVFLGVKLTVVAKPQIPNNFPFWDTMYEP